MEKKIRLIRTTIVEYVPIPEYYPGCSTIEDMAALDASSDNPNLIFMDCISDTVKWEIIESN